MIKWLFKCLFEVVVIRFGYDVRYKIHINVDCGVEKKEVPLQSLIDDR
jgi:hypothetical protein